LSAAVAKISREPEWRHVNEEIENAEYKEAALDDLPSIPEAIQSIRAQVSTSEAI
jgi:hypothetical protein